MERLWNGANEIVEHSQKFDVVIGCWVVASILSDGQPILRPFDDPNRTQASLALGCLTDGHNTNSSIHRAGDVINVNIKDTADSRGGYLYPARAWETRFPTDKEMTQASADAFNNRNGQRRGDLPTVDSVRWAAISSVNATFTADQQASIGRFVN